MCGHVHLAFEIDRLLLQAASGDSERAGRIGGLRQISSESVGAGVLCQLPGAAHGALSSSSI